MLADCVVAFASFDVILSRLLVEERIGSVSGLYILETARFVLSLYLLALLDNV